MTPEASAPSATYSLSWGPSVSSSAAWHRQPHSPPSCFLYPAKLNKSTTTFVWRERKKVDLQISIKLWQVRWLIYSLTNESIEGGIIHIPKNIYIYSGNLNYIFHSQRCTSSLRSCSTPPFKQLKIPPTLQHISIYSWALSYHYCRAVTLLWIKEDGKGLERWVVHFISLCWDEMQNSVESNVKEQKKRNGEWKAFTCCGKCGVALTVQTLLCNKPTLRNELVEIRSMIKSFTYSTPQLLYVKIK